MLRMLAIWIGKSLLTLASIRGGGSALPGLVVERLYPNFIQTLRPHFGVVVLVTGTNGKTTTTKMLQEILRCKYDTIIHNQAGSNMSRGVISAVLAAMSWQGELQAEVGLFEVDEGFSTVLSEALRPDVLAIINLHRDQLDRYGELERVVDMLRQAAKTADHTVVNYDDSKLLELSSELDSVSGISAVDQVRSQVPSEDELYNDESSGIGSTVADSEVLIKSTESSGSNQSIKIDIAGHDHKAVLSIGGTFNAYNAALALAVARKLGVNTAQAVESLSRVKPAFGRGEEIVVDNKTLQLLLIKNPSGFNQVVANFLTSSEVPVLIAINDNYADGRDVSWLWDVDLEKWQQPKSKIFTTGLRGEDMALRLSYADIPALVETETEDAIASLLDAIPPGGHGLIVPTYTAMLEIRKQLGSYTEIGGWE